jgi:hypothetical protein
MNLASKFFQAEIIFNKIRDNLYTALDEFLNDKQYSEITWDYYDISIEFLGCDLSFDLDEKQRSKLWEMGFVQCWVCYGDRSKKYVKNSGYTEKHYHKDRK